MEAMRIAICEDTQADAEHLRTIIGESAVFQIPPMVHSYQDAAIFLRAFTPHLFHLIFLDVYLDGENPGGIELAKKIRELDSEVRLVFTTTSLDHALYGYSVNALQYLVKPVKKPEIEALVQQTVKHWINYNDSITVVQGGQKRTVKTHEIIYIEVLNKQSIVHLEAECIPTYTPLDKLEKELPDTPFIRCHRSYIVNLDYVKAIDRDFVMSNGDTVYIRRGDQRKMKKLYQDYVLSLTWGGGV